jgi:hypothetical protein
MPSVTRITLFFELGDTGWSESYHTGLDPTIFAFPSLIGQLMAYRQAMLSNKVQIVDVRVSDDLLFRDIGYVTSLTPAQGVLVGRTAAPTTALLLRMYGGPPPYRYFRNLFLRGLPSTVVDGRAYTGATNLIFNAAVNAFAFFLTGGLFSIKVKDITPPLSEIVSSDAVGNIVTLSPVAGIALLSHVQIYGVPRSFLKRRAYRVGVLTDPQHFNLFPWGGQVLHNVGKIRVSADTLVPLTKVSIERITERRVGRPFGVPVGRRPPVR